MWQCLWLQTYIFNPLLCIYFIKYVEQYVLTASAMLGQQQTNITVTTRDDHVFRTISGSIYIGILLYVAFCTIMAISRQKEARSRDYALLLFRVNSRVLHSALYHREHCTLHAFEQFGALYMYNHDDKYPARPGFKPDRPTSRLQAPVDTNEPSGPVISGSNQVNRKRLPDMRRYNLSHVSVGLLFNII